MMLTSSNRRIVSCLLAGAFLFAQAIGIVQACVGPEMAPEMAFSQGMTEHDCDAPTPAKIPNPNACLQHCTAGDQTTAQVPAIVASMPGIAVLTVPMPDERPHAMARAVAYESHSPDPPRSIRFCSFQL